MRIKGANVSKRTAEKKRKKNIKQICTVYTKCTTQYILVYKNFIIPSDKKHYSGLLICFRI